MVSVDICTRRRRSTPPSFHSTPYLAPIFPLSPARERVVKLSASRSEPFNSSFPPRLAPLFAVFIIPTLPSLAGIEKDSPVFRSDERERRANRVFLAPARKTATPQFPPFSPDNAATFPFFFPLNALQRLNSSFPPTSPRSHRAICGSPTFFQRPGPLLHRPPLCLSLCVPLADRLPSFFLWIRVPLPVSRGQASRG